ncbi:MAG: VOC family protein [Treponemataceae bacterium]
MKFGYVTIMVRNIEKTIQFYEEIVQLHVVRCFSVEDGEIVFMANADNETMFEFIQFDKAEKVFATGMVLSFGADEKLEEIHKKAKNFGCDVSAIIDNPPKPKYFTTHDPDNITIEFTS